MRTRRRRNEDRLSRRGWSRRRGVVTSLLLSGCFRGDWRCHCYFSFHYCGVVNVALQYFVVFMTCGWWSWWCVWYLRMVALSTAKSPSTTHSLHPTLPHQHRSPAQQTTQLIISLQYISFATSSITSTFHYPIHNIYAFQNQCIIIL